MGDETRWVTYDELATALGIAPDSARRLVSRKRWPRQTGNDGKARIEVPVERLALDRPQDALPDSPPDVVDDTRSDDSPDVAPLVRALTRHLEYVERNLEEAKAERDVERTRANDLAQRLAEVEVARAALEGQATALTGILAERALELGQERDRVVDAIAQLMKATAQASQAEAIKADLQARLEATATELQALRMRPWWRRLAG